MRSLGPRRARVQVTPSTTANLLSTGDADQPLFDCINTPISTAEHVQHTLPNAVQSAERQTIGVQPPQLPQCLSTGGLVRRKYRLSLNSHIRNKFTRKRLNFVTSASSKTSVQPDATDSSTPASAPTVIDEMSELSEGYDDDCNIELLRQLVDSETARLASAQSQATEHRQLRDSIAQWEDGFRRAFSELLSLTTAPHNTPEKLLQMLNIPPDLINLE